MSGTTWFNNYRLSYWLAGAIFSWLLMFVLVGIPIFHLWVKVSTGSVAMFIGLCCAIQLAITPWLFSARATPLNPKGLTARRRRGAALVVEFSAISLLFLYYVWGNQTQNPGTHQFVFIGLGLTLLFAAVSLIGFFYHRGDTRIPFVSGPKR